MTKGLLSFALLFTLFTSQAQDKVVLTNGDQMIGSIKSFDNGVLEFETDYSESNFLIDWDMIKDLTSTDTFIINMSSGEKYNGSINITDQTATINKIDGETISVPFLEVVYLNSVSSGFWDRMSISLDGGFTHSKSSNNNQLTVRGTASYLTTKINPDLYGNFLYNGVDANDSVRVVNRRNNYGGNFRLFIGKSWFGVTSADFLTSDEIEMELRSTYSLGLGYYPIRNHKLYLNIATGMALNNEIYNDAASTPSNSSAEAYLSADFNAFDLENVTITSNCQYYKSLNQASRNRVNFTLDVKFDLPKDFYVGAGYTINYDSSPGAEGVSDTDYIFQTSIGWSL
ncbi:hypothetical protein BFP72_07225 [Reichenbachiella sp. 5M10]|uniref:DUF481 domain-containing protein n=1 Tax=Reichenbachiella sp. 5M10 TaxID=1889772 RepID=UPI000C14E100|nr:DUF481 domain-containing protein [Reichenbachiella sp. 5M10]PIB35200.1 hypothetical protein BFP72_07225 [Reichenbachiella sp. 5M10]